MEETEREDRVTVRDQSYQEGNIKPQYLKDTDLRKGYSIMKCGIIIETSIVE